MGIEDCVRIARHLAASGASTTSASPGTPRQVRQGRRTRTRSRSTPRPPGPRRFGLPVLVGQRIRDAARRPHRRERQGRSGGHGPAGRPANKSAEGRLGEVRGCWGSARTAAPSIRTCTARSNAEIDAAAPERRGRADTIKDVYVIGGDSAERRAARLAAGRGHRVTCSRPRPSWAVRSAVAARSSTIISTSSTTSPGRCVASGWTSTWERRSGGTIWPSSSTRPTTSSSPPTPPRPVGERARTRRRHRRRRPHRARPRRAGRTVVYDESDGFWPAATPPRRSWRAGGHQGGDPLTAPGLAGPRRAWGHCSAGWAPAGARFHVAGLALPLSDDDEVGGLQPVFGSRRPPWTRTSWCGTGPTAAVAGWPGRSGAATTSA